MARPRSGSRFPRIGGPKRLVSWEDGPEGVTVLSSVSSTVFPIAVAAIVDGLTIIRIRGELNMALDTTGAVLEGFPLLAAGLAIVSENAAGVGVTAIPSPYTDKHWDGWMWHWSGSMYTVTTAPTDAEGCAVARIVIDNKSMRKFKASDTLVGVIEAGSEVGTAQLQAVLNTRLLVKLP